MIPVDQTKLHNPPETNGNCLNACLASLLEIDIESIPHFEDMGESKWFQAVLDWLNEQGFTLLIVKPQYPPGYFIGSGKSPRGDFDHVVIYKGTEMVHDPHPSRSGLENLDEVWLLVPHDPAKFKK